MILELKELLLTNRITLHEVLSAIMALDVRIGEDNYDWINYEMNGYPPLVDIPFYRQLPCDVECSYKKTDGSEGVLPLDLSVISFLIHTDFSVYNDSKSVKYIESELRNAENPYVYEYFPPIMVTLLSNHTDEELITVYYKIPKHCFVNILTQVKQRLMVILIELENKN